ncbi:MAG: hypothetical protein PVF45_10150 [Anaerolineae bacterium]|jgi:hypothetical protein
MHDWRGWFHDPRLLLIGGVLLGIGLGLYVGWEVAPVSYYDTDLYDLRHDHQDEYVVMVGALYALERDVEAAYRALAPLSDPRAPRAVQDIVVEITERYIARGADPADITYLVGLAQALDSVTTPMQPFLGGGQP